MKNIFVLLAFAIMASSLFAITPPGGSGFSMPSFSGSFYYDPTPNLQPIATRTINDYSGLSYVDTGKITGTTDQIIGAFEQQSSNSSRVEVYSLSGSSLTMMASRNFNYSSKNTRTSGVAIAGNDILVGGYYQGASSDYPLLAKFDYTAGALAAPSYYFNSWTTPPGKTAGVDSGDVNGDGTYDYIFAATEELSGTDKTRIRVRLSNGSYASYQLPYNYGESAGKTRLKGAFIAPSNPGREIAFVGQSDGIADGYLLKYVPGSSSLSLISSKEKLFTSQGDDINPSFVNSADLDGDGNEELLVAGSYSLGGGLFNTADFVHVYGFSGSPWTRKNEYLNITPNPAYAVYAGTADIDGDGKKEIIEVAAQIYKIDSSTTGVRTKINVLRYNSTGTKLTLLASYNFQPASPSGSNGYWPLTAAMGDYNNDGKQELAINYYDRATESYKLSVLGLKDMDAPIMTFTSPTTNSIYYTNQSVAVKFKAYDEFNVKSGSLKAKITGPGGYDSGFLPGTTASSSDGTTRNFTYTKSLSGLTPGNYTITAYASDFAGNNQSSTRKFQVLSVPAAPASPPPSDTTAPALVVTTDKTTYQQGESSLISVTLSDNQPIGNPASLDNVLVSFAITGAGYDSGYEFISETAPASLVFTYSGTVSLDPGTYTITARASDTAGNLGTGTRTFTVVAPPAPTEVAPEEVAPAEVTPEEVPPAEVPPVEVPPAEVPPTEQPPSGTPSTPPAPPSGGVAPPPSGSSPPPGGSGTSAPPEGSSDAARLITALEAKISVASNQGMNTAAPAKSLSTAKKLQDEGRYTSAALEAQNGIAEVDKLLAPKQQSPALVSNPPSAPPATIIQPVQNMPDYTPYLIGAIAIVLIIAIGVVFAAGGFLLITKHPPKK